MSHRYLFMFLLVVPTFILTVSPTRVPTSTRTCTSTFTQHVMLATEGHIARVDALPPNGLRHVDSSPRHELAYACQQQHRVNAQAGLQTQARIWMKEGWLALVASDCTTVSAHNCLLNSR